MSSERLTTVLKAPHVSEKAARTQELANQYVFEVAQGDFFVVHDEGFHAGSSM